MLGASLAIGLILLALSGQSQEAVQPTLEGDPISEPRQEEGAAAGEQNAEPETESAPDYAPALKDIEAAIRATIPAINEADRKRQEQRDVDDLQAQSDMALWAERMFWAALGTLILTAVGVFLIWRTLHHTRIAAEHAGGAVNQARDANAAAHAAVDETRRIGEAHREKPIQDHFKAARCFPCNPSIDGKKLVDVKMARIRPEEYPED